MRRTGHKTRVTLANVYGVLQLKFPALGQAPPQHRSGWKLGAQVRWA